MSPTGLRADLHAHTRVSVDSQTSVRNLLKAAKAAGLHASAITDHDSVDAHKEALRLAPRFGIQVIPGAEITADDGTHILGYFISRLPEDRCLVGIIDFIKAEGGVCCLAHPHRSDTGILYNLAKKRITEKDANAALTNTDLIEVLNFKSIIRQEEDGKRVADEYKKRALASTDAHYTVEVGKAFTCFDLEEGELLTPEHLRSANRTLWSHPVRKVPAKTASVPLMNYSPSVARVSQWKRFFGPIIPLLGRILYRWQQYGQKRTKENQIAKILLESPEPKPY